jgi:hypothetical protein
MGFSGKGFHDDFLIRLTRSNWWFRLAIVIDDRADSALLSFPERTEKPESITFSKTWRQRKKAKRARLKKREVRADVGARQNATRLANSWMPSSQKKPEAVRLRVQIHTKGGGWRRHGLADNRKHINGQQLNYRVIYCAMQDKPAIVVNMRSICR